MGPLDEVVVRDVPHNLEEASEQLLQNWVEASDVLPGTIGNTMVSIPWVVSAARAASARAASASAASASARAAVAVAAITAAAAAATSGGVGGGMPGECLLPSATWASN